jgi:hypothetical protein
MLLLAPPLNCEQLAVLTGKPVPPHAGILPPDCLTDTCVSGRPTSQQRGPAAAGGGLQGPYYPRSPALGGVTGLDGTCVSPASRNPHRILTKLVGETHGSSTWGSGSGKFQGIEPDPRKAPKSPGSGIQKPSQGRDLGPFPERVSDEPNPIWDLDLPGLGVWVGVWQLAPTGNPIRAEVNGHFIPHPTEFTNWWVWAGACAGAWGAPHCAW